MVGKKKGRKDGRKEKEGGHKDGRNIRKKKKIRGKYRMNERIL